MIVSFVKSGTDVVDFSFLTDEQTFANFQSGRAFEWKGKIYKIVSCYIKLDPPNMPGRHVTMREGVVMVTFEGEI